jgi:hypothetical protein
MFQDAEFHLHSRRKMQRMNSEGCLRTTSRRRYRAPGNQFLVLAFFVWRAMVAQPAGTDLSRRFTMRPCRSAWP